VKITWANTASNGSRNIHDNARLKKPAPRQLEGDCQEKYHAMAWANTRGWKANCAEEKAQSFRHNQRKRLRQCQCCAKSEAEENLRSNSTMSLEK
jgi:hypothetical protein